MNSSAGRPTDECPPPLTRLRKLTRRELIKLGIGSAGLTLGHSPSAAQIDVKPAFLPSPFVRVDRSGQVMIYATKAEVGQGIKTALAMLVADELEADWSTVRVVQALYNPRYGDQGVGGSNSIRGSWEPFRKAGAAAREMLISAAAKEWGVVVDSCYASAGFVIHAKSKRRRPYGFLVDAAIKLPVPKNPRLKDAAHFRYIGTPAHRVDTPSKTDGSAKFSIDVRVPGMKYAVIARCPVFGGKAGKVDSAAARKLRGVEHVVAVPSGVAVIADNTFTAIQARDILKIDWDEGENGKVSSIQLKAAMDEASRKPGKVIHQTGKVDLSPAKTIEAVYEVPFQAHAPMEPVNCTAHVTANRCDVWAPAQIPSAAFQEIKKITGLPDDRINLNIMYVGGSFGRGINPDFVAEAVWASKLSGKPVKVQHTREDDIQHDFYRPMSLHRMGGALDGSGNPIFWGHHIVSTSITAWYEPGTQTPEQREIRGAMLYPSLIPNSRVDYSYVPSHVPRGWLRSVEHGPNAFACECFVDELAAAAGKDPVAFRLALLEKQPSGYIGEKQAVHPANLRRVIQTAADMAGWGKPLPPRQGRGIAAHFCQDTYVAQVHDVAVDKDGNVKVNRVVCVVDCGRVVNPDTVAAQMEGAVAFGLTQALKGAINIENGRVAERNFDNYKMLRIDEMPPVEVRILQGNDFIGGIGEPGVPPVAPALCNAIFSATGKRIRALPIRTRLLRA